MADNAEWAAHRRAEGYEAGCAEGHAAIARGTLAGARNVLDGQLIYPPIPSTWEPAIEGFVAGYRDTVTAWAEDTVEAARVDALRENMERTWTWPEGRGPGR